MSWRENIKQMDTANNLTIVAGKWAITFLSDGEQYEFERAGETKSGVSFKVNAKHLDSGGTFPNVNWGVTAKSLLRKIASVENVEGCVIKFLASGNGLQRKYESVELVEPAIQTTIKPKASKTK